MTGTNWKAASKWTALVVAVIAVIIAFLICFRLEVLVGDYFIVHEGQRGNPQDIVIVAIDEDTLATLPYRSPIDRAFLAGIIGRIDGAKPRAIGLDILIDQPSETEKDKAFVAALESTKAPLVVAYATNVDGLNDTQMAFENQSLKNVKKALVTLSRDDFDGTVRQVFMGQTIGGTPLPGFAAALAEATGHKPPYPSGRITYYHDQNGNPFKFKTYPAHSVHLLPPSWFKDKIILIGTNLTGADLHATPFTTINGADSGALFGITIHAHMLAQMISGDEIATPGAIATILIVLGLALAASLIVIAKMPPLWRMALVLLLLGLFAALTFYLFRNMHLQLPLATPVVAAFISSILLALGQWYQVREQRQFIENAFSQYLSPAVVQRIIASRKDLVLGGESRMVTYVFTDLEGFTSLSETMQPDEIAALLNDYLDKMCDLFVEADATIDKLIGDAVVGFFGAPEEQSDQAKRAVKLALAIDKFSQEYCRAQKQKGINFGITRIGVHKGEAVIGNFGGSRFMDYTGIGDTVNTASRMEAANKYLGTRICVSKAVVDDCPNGLFRAIGSIRLKGKQDLITCFEPLRDNVDTIKMLDAYSQAFELMRTKDNKARAAFADLATKYPQDTLIALHGQRLQHGASGVTITLKDK